MARSIHELIFEAMRQKHPGIVTKLDHILNISAVTMPDGTEAFQFLRPNLAGNVDPVSGLLFGEYAALSRANLEEYSQKNFGRPLPKVISPHRIDSEQYGNPQIQSPSSSAGVDPRYGHVKGNGINVNHGWKIHADLVADLEEDRAFAAMGRNIDFSIADQTVADAFDQRLINLGMDPDDFVKNFRNIGIDPRGGNTKFVNPNDMLSTMEVFEKHGIVYKMSPYQYGEGKHITAYPQDIVNRDKLITDLESTLGERLVDQNDPNYRLGLDDPGVKNHPLSRGVSGRFTTDYLAVDPNTGQVDFSLDTASRGAKAAPDEYVISGKITVDEINNINRVTAEMPEMAELLHGPDGYVSPHKTIEQIVEGRASGAIPPTLLGRLGTEEIYGSVSPLGKLGGEGVLPTVNKPGSTVAAAPTPDPVMTPPLTSHEPISAPAPKTQAAPTPSSVTTEGAKRPMVAANYSKMSDEDLIARHIDLLKQYENFTPEQKADPKSFAQMTKGTIAASERELKKRGLEIPTLDSTVTTATTTQKASDTPSSSPKTSSQETAEKVSDNKVLSEEPPKSPRKGPGDLGTPSNIRTKPNPKGSDMSSTATGAKTSTQNANATANVTTNAPKTTTPPSPPSSGAPGGKATRGLLDDAMEAAKNVAAGKNNARMLGILGAATIAGVGINRLKRRDSQNQGSNTYLDESRRKLGY